MTRMKRWLAAGFAAAAMVGAANATVYTWDGGGGSNHNFDACANWNHELFNPCWPNTASHSALFPTGSTWSVTLDWPQGGFSNVQISDLEFDASTTVSGSSGTSSLLRTHGLTISGGTSSS